MEIKNNYRFLSFILIFLSFSSFFLGFYLDENAAGGGSYLGDWVRAWPNIQIFLNHEISTAINHEVYETNRSPLLYILHGLFNPFAETEIGYRRSVFVISLLVPALFYLCLKQKFQKKDNLLLLLVASCILLSPYFRTSSYWGLEENYGIISLLLTFLFLNSFLKNEKENSYKIYFQLFLLVFFSSVCVYFDQKLLIIPIICFVKIIVCKKLVILKIFSAFSYFILSLPYIYLIILWEGMLPMHDSMYPDLGKKLYPDHIGYVCTIIAFYFLPFLFFKDKNFLQLIQSFFLKKKNNYLILLFLAYLLFLLIFSFLSQQDFLNINYSLGKGFIHKFSLVLFQDPSIRSIFVYFSFFVAWIIILIFLENNLKDSLILFYFFILSIIITPILQEYFDPLILVMILTFFSSKVLISYKNSMILFLYLSIFLISSNIYYYNLFN